MMPQFYLVLLGSYVFGAGAEFLCPPSIVGVTDDTKSPCGEGASRGDFHLDVDPGPFTIHWRQNVHRPGSSFRVSLRSWDERDNETFCILRDRIPSAECQGAGGEGECSDRMYHQTIDIPDIPCENCYLQITTIFPSDTDCMVALDGHRADCPTFHSCSSIRIRSIARRKLRTCEEDHIARENDWPYKPTTTERGYKVDFRDSEEFPNGVGRLDHIPYPTNPTVSLVKYNISLNVGVHVWPYPILNDGKIAWNSGDRWMILQPLIMIGYGNFIGTLPAVYRFAKDALLANKWVIAVRHKPERIRDLPYNTSYIPVKRSSEMYSDLSQNYTADGWLTGPVFDDVNATLAHVIQPVGVCYNYTTIPITRATKPPPTVSPRRTRPYPPSKAEVSTPATIIVCVLSIATILYHRVQHGVCQRIF